MAVGDHWSREEVEALVADYLQMLMLEISGRPFRKSDHRRELQSVVRRSDASIERKHMNVSAVMLGLGYPYINGYKPLPNFQALLAEVVAGHLRDSSALADALRATLEEAAEPLPLNELPLQEDLLAALQAPPPPLKDGNRIVREQPGAPRLELNWLQLEAARNALGFNGEEWVLRYEDQRLRAAGELRLASRIEHVSRTQGDGLGYDIISFETSGKERLIEVKTTRFGEYTPFFISRNEVRVSAERAEQYHLYRLYNFHRKPELYTLAGSLAEICRLEAVNYEARAW